MEKVTDWAMLWRQLVEMQHRRHMKRTPDEQRDPWKERARDYDAAAKKRLAERGTIQELVTSQVNSNMTVLDIGAGGGRWSIYLANHAKSVTAIDPSASMLALLRENLKVEQANNVVVIPGSWPDVGVAPHDITLCSHAMYFYPDFPHFVQRMVEVTHDTCCLIMRVPAPDGVMGAAAQRIWGQPYDSANFVIGYNILLDMGIRPNVLMDPTLKPWTSASLDEALNTTKDRMGLGDNNEHNQFLRELLDERLVLQDGQYVWPDGMRSALIYWKVS